MNAGDVTDHLQPIIIVSVPPIIFFLWTSYNDTVRTLSYDERATSD